MLQLNLIKPRVLSKRSRVAVISPSWGGPEKFPHRHEAGLRALRDNFDVDVVEMPHTRAENAWLTKNPRARADDIMAAFSDASIDGIIASIGGDDSIRLLPYIDFDIIKNNPKVLMGYSDTTSVHFMCLHAGLSTFYGPSIMAGFAENGGMHDYTRKSVIKTLFETDVIGQINPAPNWTIERMDWGNPDNQHKSRDMIPGGGYCVLNGCGIVSGHLIGGCVEVLEMIKGTSIWPSIDTWRGAILFLETSEDQPPVEYMKYWLRNYGSQGILDVLAGIIIGRAQEKPDHQNMYDDTIVGVIRDEFGRNDLPVLSRLNFGHTDPMFILPYGAMAKINCDTKQFSILESGTVPSP